MADAQRRKWARKDTLNLVDYIVLGEDGAPLRRGMGRTRNVSQGGFLLETHRTLEKGAEVLITLGLKRDMVKVKGRVVRQMPPSERYRHSAGIKLTHMNKKDREILKRYIDALKTGHSR